MIFELHYLLISKVVFSPKKYIIKNIFRIVCIYKYYLLNHIYALQIEVYIFDYSKVCKVKKRNSMILGNPLRKGVMKLLN